MAWMDHQEKLDKNVSVVEQKDHVVEFKLPGHDQWIKGNKFNIRRVYSDAQPGLIIVIDEIAELLLQNSSRTEEDKAENKLKQEIVSIIQSITQLGRSAGVHMVLCTQRPDATIIPGVIQNNPLDTSTKIRVLRRKT